MKIVRIFHFCYTMKCNIAFLLGKINIVLQFLKPTSCRIFILEQKQFLYPTWIIPKAFSIRVIKRNNIRWRNRAGYLACVLGMWKNGCTYVGWPCNLINGILLNIWVRDSTLILMLCSPFLRNLFDKWN